MKQPSAFVTYGWCRSSYVVLRSLASAGIQVHLGDASPFAMSRYSRYAGSFQRIPDFFLDPDSYFDRLYGALTETGARVLLPCHEDVGIISRRRHELPPGVLTAVPDWQTYQAAEDKFLLMEIAQRVGCPVPNTRRIESVDQLLKAADEFSRPVVLKTRIGNSAKGVAIVRDRSELETRFSRLVEQYGLAEDRWPFLQEYLPGRAIGICALYNQGRRVAWFSEEYLRCKEPGLFGTSTLRRASHQPEVMEQALSVLDHLKWHGLAHMDFIQDAQGTYKLIEINPRPWGALALAVHAGVDFPRLWYQAALGETPEFAGSLREVSCRWILGECMAAFGALRQGRLRETAGILKWVPNCCYDDFSVKDPLPFLFEWVDYLSKFIRAGGSINPVGKNMIR